MTDDSSVVKKEKVTKKCITKPNIRYYKNILQKKILRSQQRFKSEAHTVLTERSTRLLKVLMMTKDYRFVLKSHHMYIAQVLEECVKHNR